MAFHDHRPNRRLGRSERPLIKLTSDLTSFLHKAQRSLAHDTLHLSSQQRSLLAHILVEFAEDLYQDIGIWKSLEAYNLDFFGTPLPCVLQPDETMDSEPINPARIQFLLWTLYTELEPELTFSPNHQDLQRLAVWIADFLSERFTRLPFESGVKTFLATPNQYGWEVKRKLIWLGHSYLFRLNCENYVRAHGGKADVPTIDDFLCQETTSWSGLGVNDILASTLDITDEQRRDLRSWYERHTGYFRVLSVHEPLMDVQNLLNERSYTIRAEHLDDTFHVDQLVFGSLVPWDNEWYWSGMQYTYDDVSDEAIQQVKQDFSQRSPQIAYRYCDDLAETARDMTRKDYEEFVSYFGDDLATFPDGYTMAAAMKKLYEQRFESAPKEAVDAFVKKHNLSKPAPTMSYPPELLESDNGIGLYFYPGEGIEIMNRFDDVINGLKKKGRDLTEEEWESIKGVMRSEAICPQFMMKLIQEYGDESVASTFFIRNTSNRVYLEYLFRRYKGHFYRNRYPSLSIVGN